MNGWMVIIYQEAVDTDSISTCETFVYEDKEPEGVDFYVLMSGASSLQSLLWDHFSYYLRSKKMGGLELTLHKKGRECE